MVGSLASLKTSAPRLRFKMLSATSAQGEATLVRWSRQRRGHGTGTGGGGTNNSKFRSDEEKLEYLREANRTLQKYEDARQLFKQGKLPGQQQNRESSQQRGGGGASSANLAQVGVLSLFLVAFIGTPFLGKKIATDEEFRSKWVPSWYDFTVKKPENPWTREELHEQMVRVQKDLRERAIRGEFTEEKLREMRESLEFRHLPGRDDIKSSAPGTKKKRVPEGWDRIHPGADSDTDVNE